jgi:hypothetical protein
MSASAPIFQNELFQAADREKFVMPVRVVRKSGEAWLILPEPKELAAQALALYPAQTFLGKTARGMLGAALRLGLPFGSQRMQLVLAPEDSFVRFLRGLMPVAGELCPPLAMLAGNPRAWGRRFIVLLFAERHPIFVVKAGVRGEARQLVQKENLFLRSVPAGVAGVPKVKSAFASAQVEALAMEHVAGESARAEDWAEAGTLLSSWVNRERRVRLEAVGAWQRLKVAHRHDPIFQKLSAALRSREFSTTLYHGDFAPWNIKVSNKQWTALDWERGELTGVPGWDWFHYVAQSGILVKKLSAEKLMAKLEQLIEAKTFRDYAERAGIAGCEKALAVAYLFYCAKELRPTEGADTGERVLALSAERWLK